MDSDQKCCGKHFSIEETEDGYIIRIKGDKEKLKAKIEAVEAYFNFRQKAKAAGFGPFGPCGPMGSHHGHNCGPISSMIRKHMDEIYEYGSKCKEEKTEE